MWLYRTPSLPSRPCRRRQAPSRAMSFAPCRGKIGNAGPPCQLTSGQVQYVGREETEVAEMSDEARPVPDKLRDWLSHAVRSGASDLHLIAGYPPVLRLHG